MSVADGLLRSMTIDDLVKLQDDLDDAVVGNAEKLAQAVNLRAVIHTLVFEMDELRASTAGDLPKERLARYADLIEVLPDGREGELYRVRPSGGQSGAYEDQIGVLLDVPAYG